jgi:hypothetical protein
MPANNAFQQAVKKDVSREKRTGAISTLIERNDARNLIVIVRMGGLSGTFRRQALEGLSRCRSDGRDRLKELSEDRAVAPALRSRASELIK